MNTNCESMAYRSFSPLKFNARGVRKVTTGMNYLTLLAKSPRGAPSEPLVSALLSFPHRWRWMALVTTCGFFTGKRTRHPRVPGVGATHLDAGTSRLRRRVPSVYGNPVCTWSSSVGLGRVISAAIGKISSRLGQKYQAGLYRARKGVVGQTLGWGASAKVRAIPTGNSAGQHSGSRPGLAHRGR